MPEFVQLIVSVAFNKNTVNIYLFELVTQVALFLLALVTSVHYTIAKIMIT